MASLVPDPAFRVESWGKIFSQWDCKVAKSTISTLKKLDVFVLKCKFRPLFIKIIKRFPELARVTFILLKYMNP